MTPREIAKQLKAQHLVAEIREWEELANDPRVPVTDRDIYAGCAKTASKALEKDAAELRAALPEQSLAKQWREEAEWNADAAREDLDSGHRNSAMRATGKASAYRQCASDLDARHDEGQELLREACAALEVEDEHSDSPMKRIHGDLIARIRKHLKEPSDEA